VESPRITAGRNAILLFDGIFLHRPELIPHWDFTSFVDSSFENVLHRALIRDRNLFGSTGETRRRYEERYIPGQRIYLNACNPAGVADVVFVNNEFERPELVMRSAVRKIRGGSGQKNGGDAAAQ
jgi:uridine kinase